MSYLASKKFRNGVKVYNWWKKLEPITCEKCKAKFTRRDNFKRHIKSKHSNSDERCICQRCSKPLSRGDSLKRHMETCKKNPQDDIESKRECSETLHKK